MAIAIETKNLDFLLSALDGDANETSKRTIASVYGVKIHGLKAKDRRRAVFALAGFVTDDEYQQANAAYIASKEARREAKKQEQDRLRKATRVQDARLQVARKQFRFEGVVMDGASFIDKVWADGFNTLDTRKRGAVARYILCNKETGSFFPLKKEDGTVEYVEALIERELECV